MMFPIYVHSVRPSSLHLIEHIRERRLELEGLLDLIGAYIGILTVFEETRAMVITHKLDEGLCVRLPILGETFQILEDRVQTSCGEDGHGIFGVFIEISIKDAHVLEVRVTFDLEEIPAQIVQLEHREQIRLTRYPFLD